MSAFKIEKLSKTPSAEELKSYEDKLVAYEQQISTLEPEDANKLKQACQMWRMDLQDKKFLGSFKDGESMDAGRWTAVQLAALGVVMGAIAGGLYWH